MKQKILKRLRLEFIGVWVLGLIMMALHEFDVCENGQLANNATAEYIMETAAVLLTFGLIYCALRLFATRTVRQRISQEDPTQALASYRKWSEVRYALFLVPLLYDLQVYYLTLNANASFCALAVVAATFFCWPTEKKMDIEMQTVEGRKEKGMKD